MTRTRLYTWRRVWIPWLGLIGASSSLAAVVGDAPIVLRDAHGSELRLAHSPARIVSLLPSLTETVCALGECARLVATDRYSNWPEAVTRLPKAGGLGDTSIELIVGLKPDVVLLSYAPRVADRLHELGIATFDVDTRTYADIARTVTVLGELLAVPQRASDLNHDIESSVEKIADAQRRRFVGRSPLVYYEVDGGPYAAGPASFMGEMLARLGARNILSPELGPFPKLNPEFVVRSNPDVIFTDLKDAPLLDRRPGWERIRAVREKRICAFDARTGDTIVRPGPRVAEGFRAVSDCLDRVAP
jgi:iron complex transport system substrate-binding protein